MSTCATCRHWHAKPNSVHLADSPLGECRQASPSRSFTWPRTRAVDTCGQHSTTEPKTRRGQKHLPL